MSARPGRSTKIELRARATATFPPLSSTPGEARLFARETFADWGVARDSTDDVLLLTTEIVTNAVVHAGTDVEVTIELSGDRAIVTIGDGYSARALPAVPAQPHEMSERGRGLLLVQRIASRWGVEYSPAGKRVWFETPVEVQAGAVTADVQRPPDASVEPLVGSGVLVATVTVDRTGHVTGWHGDAEQLLGWAESGVVGRPIDDLVRIEGSQASLHDHVAASGRWHGAVLVRHADSTEVAVYGSHQLVPAAGGMLCIWTTLADRWALQPVQAPHAVSAAPRDDAAMLGLTGSLSARLGLDDLLAQVLRRVCSALGGDAAYMLLADDLDGYELRAAYGFDVDAGAALKARSTEGIAGRLSAHSMPVIVDSAADSGDPLLAAQGLNSAVAVPLMLEGRTTGSLHVAARRARAFAVEDGVRLAQVTDRLALAIESARLDELERKRRGWLAYVAEASDLLAGTLDLDRTLALVAQLIVPALGEWCCVHILEEGGETRLAYVWHADEAKGDELRGILAAMPVPERRTSSREAPPSRRQPWRPPLVPELQAYDRVVYPLVARNTVRGSLMVGRSYTARFRSEEIELASDLARRAALAIDNARLFQERVAVATALQRSLLPPEAPLIDGCEIGVAYLAPGEGNVVGGDFYDVFPIGADHWGVAVGDVCGKGADAAAVTGLARHTIRLLGRDKLGITDVLARLNSAILEEGPRARFLTVAFAVVHPTATGAAVELCSAGHPLPMLLATDGTVRQMGEPQSLLGVLPEVDLASQRIELSAGDTMVLFTDGVTERRQGVRMLGEEGLAKILRSCAGLPATAIAARIERAVVDFQPEPPRDDMAVVVIRVLGTS